MSEQVCVHCGASSVQVGLMKDGGVWRCINEYNCVEREEAQEQVESPE